MRSFELLSHTADLRLKASGDSLEELFHAALQGMAKIIKDDFCQNYGSQIKNYEKVEKKISISATDRTTLLIDFLSEVLTVSQTEKVVFCDVNFEKLTEMELAAKVKGTKVDEFDEDIKAVTYHEAEVKKNKNGQWETIIILDI